MIEIKVLSELDPGDIRRLNCGYTSSARYVVKKSESHARTVISLELVSLSKPYVKHWPTTDEDLQRYQEIVPQGLSLGAYDGGHMVAIAIAEAKRWNRSLWVWEFHVAETHRRMRIGYQLMEALAQRAKAAGMRTMVCETQNTNQPAIAFYRAVGFKIEAVDLSYYTNNDLAGGEVAIFMKRKLE